MTFSRRRPWAYLLYAVASFLVLLWAAPRTNAHPKSRLPEMVAGTAYRPYVRRFLIPLAVRGVDTLLPEAARVRLGELVARHPTIARSLGWQPLHASWFAIVSLLHWLALFLFAVFFRRLLDDIYRVRETTAAFAATAACLLVPIHFGYANFVYDFPELALFTWGLVLIQERRWAGFYLLLPIGLLNKETFVLLSALFWLRQKSVLRRTELAAHLLLQLGVAGAVGAALSWAFRDNPGVFIETHLVQNLTYYGRTPRGIAHDALYWGLWVYSFLWWRDKKPVAQMGLLLAVPLLSTMVVFGVKNEYRALYEMFPVLCLLSFHTTLRLLGSPPRLRESANADE